ncbi:Ras-related protein RABE1d [Amphibalanus amphitrite]|uniref:Ras-related protein RABE1d n=1 Tax=Amphibalanus amphitrite TaxID=1232801 RepID=A0A6A4VI87_AMPAM|nr:Ras-related protein RABE1d [Amphibalanus amphitrite]
MGKGIELSCAVDSDLVLVVVGNKADLGSERAVPEAMARTLAAARGAHYYETSARNNLGVDNVFYHTALQLGQRMICSCGTPGDSRVPGQGGSTSYGTLSLGGESYRTVSSELLRLQHGSCCY